MRKMHFLLIICLFACTNTTKKTTGISKVMEEGIRTIDLSNPKFSNDKMLLSDLVEDAEYIKLETSDDALIAAGKTCVDNDYVYILNGVVYLFNRKDGSFIRKIGKIGQGPGEFRMARDFAVAGGKVYVLLNYQDKIYTYDVETGDFLGDIDCTGWAMRMYVHPNQNITLLRGSTLYKYQFTFMTINPSGDTLLFKSPDIKLSDEILEKRRGAPLPFISTFWITDSHLNCYDSMTDTIYAVNGDVYRARFHIQRGSYGMEAEKYFTTEWGKTVSEKGWTDYLKLAGFIENSQYIYIYLDYKDIYKESHWARYDKQTGEVKWWHNKFSEEDPESAKFFKKNDFYNDFDGGKDNLFQVNEQYAMTYITDPPFDRKLTPDDFVTTNPLYPEKQAKLKKLIDEMGEEDNPIIVIYKLK